MENVPVPITPLQENPVERESPSSSLDFRLQIGQDLADPFKVTLEDFSHEDLLLESEEEDSDLVLLSLSHVGKGMDPEANALEGWEVEGDGVLDCIQTVLDEWVNGSVPISTQSQELMVPRTME